MAALARRRAARDGFGDDAVPLGAAPPAARLLLAGASGPAVAFVLWVLFSLALSYYVSHSNSFGTVYGPLTGMFALLLWSQLTSLSLLFGIALAAQLEAVRAGVPVAGRSRPREGAGRAHRPGRRPHP